MTRKSWDAREKEKAERRTGKVHTALFMSPEARADGERLLAEVPPDTRELTSRICGDPIPGRRAIDLKHKGQ